jgi:GDP-L-fucose synthase
MSIYQGKSVLVTGGTGMVGQQLVRLLLEAGAKVRIASLDDPSRAHPKAEFKRVNLTKFEPCEEVCRGMDYVFQLLGVKGSPAVSTKKPASFFVPTLLFNTNMMEAARQANVKWYLYTSSVGVYAPAEVFYEDDVWKTFPSENDKFTGWAKRVGELQAEAYAIEYGWKQTSIVRPANIYGPYDNFDPANAMVVPSLIRRALSGEDPLTVWGDGSPIRDFIHAEDVARGMMLAVEKGITEPINLGSGKGVTIKQLVDIIVSHLPKRPQVVWDTSKPAGDKKRLMDMTRARKYGFEPQISFDRGIAGVIEWYLKNKAEVGKRYNVFDQKNPLGT